MNIQVKTLDFVVAGLISLLAAIGLYFFIQNLAGNGWNDIGWRQLGGLMLLPMAGIVVFLLSVLLVRSLPDTVAEWVPTLFSLGAGALLCYSVITLESDVEYTASNPVIEYNEGGADNSEISITGLDLPKGRFGRVSVFVVERHDLTADEATAIANGTPHKIPVPKNAKGQVFFRVDNRKPSQATGFGH